VTNSTTGSVTATGAVDETANVLIATRSCFRYTALDHMHLVSMVQSRKRHEILDAVKNNLIKNSCAAIIINFSILAPLFYARSKHLLSSGVRFIRRNRSVSEASRL